MAHAHKKKSLQYVNGFMQYTVYQSAELPYDWLSETLRTTSVTMCEIEHKQGYHLYRG